jgi:hypothetical protein
MPLRERKLREQLVRDSTEQIAEDDERQRALGLGGSGGENDSATRPRLGDAPGPECRLSDSGFALKDERLRAVRNRV